MSGHTPGPWTLTTVLTSCGICHKIGPFPWKNDKQNHACVYADYPGNSPLDSELLSNARLIAAAPDLLEALDLLLRDVGIASSLPGAVMARAAIVKASVTTKETT